MNRRELVEQTLLLTMTASVLADAGPAFGATTDHAKLAETADRCARVGAACAKHCEDMMAKGNKDMAECLTTVQDMVIACDALAKLASRGSKHTAAMAKTCATICAECAKVCEPHKAMAECKACMESCKDCEAACKAA